VVKGKGRRVLFAMTQLESRLSKHFSTSLGYKQEKWGKGTEGCTVKQS
jgi:hypothetical protein